MKTQKERLQECLTLRQKWLDELKTPFPEALVRHMNAFVKEGAPSSGKVPFYSRTIEYCFTLKHGKDTYIRITGGSS